MSDIPQNPFTPAQMTSTSSYPALKRGPTDAFRLYGEPILTLKLNGVIDAGKDYQPSEAGEAFLAYVREKWSQESSCKHIREMERYIKTLEEAGDRLALYPNTLSIRAWRKAKETKP